MPPSDAQWAKLLDFVEDDAELRTGQYVDGPNGKIRLASKWAAAAKDLNRCGPDVKTGPQWREAFYGLRSRARQAYADQVTYLRGTGGGEAVEVEDLIPNPIYARCLRLTGTVSADGNDGVASSLQAKSRQPRQPNYNNYGGASTSSCGSGSAAAGPSWAGGSGGASASASRAPGSRDPNCSPPRSRPRLASPTSVNRLAEPSSSHALHSEISEQLSVLQCTLADLLESIGQLCTSVQGSVSASAFYSSSLAEALQDLQGSCIENTSAIVSLSSAIHAGIARTAVRQQPVQVQPAEAPGIQPAGQNQDEMTDVPNVYVVADDKAS